MARKKVAFVDIDTQFDFMDPRGSLYVPQAEKTVPNLRRLLEWARAAGVPILSSVDAHTPDDPEFQSFPPHCVAGTAGQKKIPETCVGREEVIPNTPGSAPSAVAGGTQLILEKQKFDVFSNANTDAILETIDADEFVVFGVATDYCVKAAVLGLLERGGKVHLVEDAIRPVTEEGGKAAVSEMTGAGAHLTTTEGIIRLLETE